MKRILPIYVSWTKGTKDWEAELIIEGMRSLLQFVSFRPQIKIFGSASWRDEKESFSSPDWYQDHNIVQLPRRNLQISAPGIWRDIEREPWQEIEGHLDFMIFDQDLNTQIFNEKTQKFEWINFIFGEGGEMGTIISVFRFRNRVSILANYKLLLRWIGQHEFGHVLGLVHREGKGSDAREDLYRGHCVNLCVMQQTMSVPETEDLALRLNQRGIILCEECQQELKSYW